MRRERVFAVLTAVLLACMFLASDSGAIGHAARTGHDVGCPNIPEMSSAEHVLAHPQATVHAHTLRLRGGQADVDSLLQELMKLPESREEQSSEDGSAEDQPGAESREIPDPEEYLRAGILEEDELSPDSITSTMQFHGMREKGRRFLNKNTLQALLDFADMPRCDRAMEIFVHRFPLAALIDVINGTTSLGPVEPVGCQAIAARCLRKYLCDPSDLFARKPTTEGIRKVLETQNVTAGSVCKVIGRVVAAEGAAESQTPRAVLRSGMCWESTLPLTSARCCLFPRRTLTTEDAST
jgi:hypothetical protein